jgi:small subunit ribosomal protein S21
LVSIIVHNSFGAGTANIDQSLKSLQRKMQREAIVREMKAKRCYEKPSIKRRRKLEEAYRRRRKADRKVKMDVSYRGFVLLPEDEGGERVCTLEQPPQPSTQPKLERDVGHS